MSVQLVSTFVMFLAGIMVGAVIDCVRHMTSSLPKKSIFYKLAPFIEIAFWAILGTITFYFLFLIKGGEWRAIDPIAQIAGIISYDLFFQPIIRFIGRVFVNITIRPVLFVGRLVFLIIRKIIHIVIRIVKLLVRPFSKIYKTSKKRFNSAR
ncbi:spore cortex biosynthesis protein YabQ [Lysinibacillus sp. 3P01SB]|uniref:spore cortex biosynthesis protein YabQ n=1 Tax=Lysinibacillus sp. 3P01SB TaxID=3132284 RepID=UPI0039A739E8